MSANMDKSLYQAPVGVGQDDAEPIEVVIGEPAEVEIHIEVGGGGEEDFGRNLAEDMDESVLQSLAKELIGDYDRDVVDRNEWLETYVKGLKLLGLKYEEKTEPWSGASGVFHPLLMESAVRFQAEMITETFPAAGPVRTKLVGKETAEKKQAAIRVEADMNYTLTEAMPEYRPEHEKVLLTTALAGNAFKKIYFNPSISLPEAPYIPPEDVIVPYGATSIESAERVTHRMRKTKNELRKLQVAGFYRDIEMGEPVVVMDEVEKQKSQERGYSATADKRFQLLEMHVECDLPGYEDENGVAHPYVVTIEKGSGNVLAIRRNWSPDDDLKRRRQHFIHYGYIPGFGFYHFGLIHLIGGHTQTATSLLRQLIDAGTLSNLPGGLKSKGLRMKADDTPIAPGEFRDVDLPSGSIRDNILPLPYKEPSQVLMALMDKVVQDGRQFAATADLQISDMSAQAPVGTTLAILERVLKVMSAVQARIHFTMKQEFKLIAAIIRDNTPEDYDYDPEVGDRGAKRSDYDCCEVLPVSDPNASTMAQRVIQYQAVIQLASAAPQIYDLPFLHRQMIETIGVKNANKIVPLRDDMKPMDPVAENMAVMVGKPVKAFMYQDHKAHIAVHMAAMQDPKIMAVIGQNPQAQAIMAAGAAHLMEHVAFEYRSQMQQTLGATLPPPPHAALAGSDHVDDDGPFLDPGEEVKVSQLAAMAAQQLLQKNTSEQQQQQIQQQQQDPIIQMQQQELQLKQQQLQLQSQQAQHDAQMKEREFQLEMQVQQEEIARKKQKDILDAAAKKDELALREKEIMLTNELAGAKIGTDIGKHRDNLQQSHQDRQHEMAGRGIDLLKHAATLEQQKETQHADHAHQAGAKAADHVHQADVKATDITHQVHQTRLKHAHEAEQNDADRAAQAAAVANQPTGEGE